MGDAGCGEITLSTSSDTVVEGNTVIGRGQPGMNNGITVTMEDRGVGALSRPPSPPGPLLHAHSLAHSLCCASPGALGRRLLANVTVRHNTIIAETCGSRNGVVDLWNGTGM